MQRHWWRLLCEATLLTGVLIASLWVFSGAAEKTHFHLDESGALWQARYFSYLFLERDLSKSEWGDNFVTHTQPMMTRYILGGWLWAHGYDLFKMPRPYVWDKSLDENRATGRVPPDALLAQARAPMVLFAAGAIGVLYLLARVLGGLAAGLTAALLALGSPVVQETLVRALPDGPVAFFQLLGLLLALCGARRGTSGRVRVGCAFAAGLSLGLGLGTKLTTVLGIVAVTLWGALTAAVAIRERRDRPAADRLARAWAAARAWALCLATSYVVFVLTNPHLYPNPLLHTMHLFADRAEELVGQQSVTPYAELVFQRSYLAPDEVRLPDVLPNPLDRPRYVLGASLIGFTASGARGVPVEPVLALVGVVVLLSRIRRRWIERGETAGEALFVLTVLTYFAGISAGLLHASPRYFAPTLLLGNVLSGVGVSAIVSLAPTFSALLRGRRVVAQRSPLTT